MKKVLTLVATAICILTVPHLTYADTSGYDAQTAVVSKIVGTVTARSGLNLRTTPSITSAVITTLPQDIEVSVISKSQNNWYNVTYDGQTGWVYGLYLDVDTDSIPKSQTEISRSDNSVSSEILDNAMSLLGTPYVFGGTSLSGFDCSGFTQYVFKGSNISLPRTSSEQFEMGSSVSKTQLQAGDLVFFTTYASGASHVGIYIGDDQFIAACNQGVSISSLDNDYYSSRYLGARRVF